jgi:octaprenyl-diphosphate synthase
MVAEAKARLPALPEASQQAALELVADGVVDRYS